MCIPLPLSSCRHLSPQTPPPGPQDPTDPRNPSPYTESGVNIFSSDLHESHGRFISLDWPDTKLSRQKIVSLYSEKKENVGFELFRVLSVCTYVCMYVLLSLLVLLF